MSAIRFRNAALPNIIITGTGPCAFAGVTNVISIFTLIAGHAELSACPTSCFLTTGKTPTFSSVVLVTVQVTPGAFGRDAAQHLALEVLDDLRTPLMPPLRWPA